MGNQFLFFNNAVEAIFAADKVFLFHVPANTAESVWPIDALSGRSLRCKIGDLLTYDTS